MLIAAALLLAGQVGATVEPVPVDVVVTARKRRCDVSIANRVISDAEFKARAAEWAAGVPVRVVAPASADYKCLAKIAFRLADHGVTRITFLP